MTISSLTTPSNRKPANSQKFFAESSFFRTKVAESEKRIKNKNPVLGENAGYGSFTIQYEGGVGVHVKNSL